MENIWIAMNNRESWVSRVHIRDDSDIAEIGRSRRIAHFLCLVRQVDDLDSGGMSYKTSFEIVLEKALNMGNLCLMAKVAKSHNLQSAKEQSG
jgi:hypothetical protein